MLSLFRRNAWLNTVIHLRKWNTKHSLRSDCSRAANSSDALLGKYDVRNNMITEYNRNQGGRLSKNEAVLLQHGIFFTLVIRMP
jgi:hypothetical protein